MNDTSNALATVPSRYADVRISAETGVVDMIDVSKAIEVAQLMARSDVAVPKYLRNNPGACLSVALQANGWRMDPFAVARMSYSVNDQIAYLAQLIHAVIEKRAPLKNRLRFDFAGEGQSRQVIVTGHFKNEVDPVIYTSPKLSDIRPQNSPLWKVDPDQQLCYYGSRSWARRYCPDVLFGVYSTDELDGQATQHIGAEAALDVTPSSPAEEPLHHRLSARAAVAAGFDERGIVDTLSQVSTGSAPSAPAKSESPRFAPGGEAAADGEAGAPAVSTVAAADQSPSGDAAPDLREAPEAETEEAHSPVSAGPQESSPEVPLPGEGAQRDRAPEPAAAAPAAAGEAEEEVYAAPEPPKYGSQYPQYVRDVLRSPVLQISEIEVRKWWSSDMEKRRRNGLPNFTSEVMDVAKGIIAEHLKKIQTQE